MKRPITVCEQAITNINIAITCFEMASTKAKMIITPGKIVSTNCKFVLTLIEMALPNDENISHLKQDVYAHRKYCCTLT